MLDFNAIANLPEVVGVVLSDSSGALLEVAGNVDGEACGAVHSYSVVALSQAGEMLGLGAFQRTSITGARRACTVSLQDGTVLGIYVDPSKQFAMVEKKLQDLLQR